MSYTFGNAGGTTWGAKTFNQIFAPNSENPTATEYWDKSQVEDYDTVVCSTNFKVLTAKYVNRAADDSTQILHWFTTGVYLCETLNNVKMGDYVICSETAGASVRPYVGLIDGSLQEEYGIGVVLTAGDRPGASGFGDFVTVATLGNWPVRRNGSVDRNNHAIPSTTAREVGDQSTNADGAVGKFYTTDFDIIQDANDVPSTEDGAILTMWGRTEVY